MKKKIKKFLHNFYKGAYAVGYRHVSDKATHFDNTQPFEVLEPTLHRWYADSFPFVENGREYIFVEIMDDANGEKGTIGVIDLQDNKGFVEIINEPFHMSFPNTFKFKNDIYMMPETSEANQLRLYKAVDFPYKWELQLLRQRTILCTLLARNFRKKRMCCSKLIQIHGRQNFLHLRETMWISDQLVTLFNMIMESIMLCRNAVEYMVNIYVCAN